MSCVARPIPEDEREAAWDAVHEALPARWCVGRPSYDPGVVRADGYRGAWSVTARGPHPGRGKMPQSVTAVVRKRLLAWALMRVGQTYGNLSALPSTKQGRLAQLVRALA